MKGIIREREGVDESPRKDIGTKGKGPVIPNGWTRGHGHVTRRIEKCWSQKFACGGFQAGEKKEQLFCVGFAQLTYC